MIADEVDVTSRSRVLGTVLSNPTGQLSRKSTNILSTNRSENSAYLTIHSTLHSNTITAQFYQPLLMALSLGLEGDRVTSTLSENL